MQSMFNSLQNCKCSFIFTTLLEYIKNAKISTPKKFLYFSKFSLPPPLLVHKIILTISAHTAFIFFSNHQQFFHLSFWRKTIPTMSTKNIFPTSAILPIQAALMDQGARNSWEDRHCFNFFLLPQNMDSQSVILYN